MLVIFPITDRNLLSLIVYLVVLFLIGKLTNIIRVSYSPNGAEEFKVYDKVRLFFLILNLT